MVIYALLKSLGSISMLQNLNKLYAIVFLQLWLLALPAFAQSNQPVTVKILGINDFHGQIVTGRKVNGRPVGGAAAMASYLKQGKRELANDTIVAFSGDQVGASSPVSGLLNHESSILFFNTLGNSQCRATDRFNAKCNIVATFGNHEFDQGQQALLDLINGTNKQPTKNWIPLKTYPGSSFPYISANIVSTATGKPLFKPYVIKEINGAKIGFIGAILKATHEVALPKNIEGLTFLDEAEAINRYVPEIKAAGADAIVVIIHQGGDQLSYEGQTRPDATDVVGPIVSIVNQLDDNVDVVMGAHYHLFINAYLPNKKGKKILVTEASCYSSAFSEVTLSLDPKKHTVLNKSARVITTYADQWPGNAPDVNVANLVKLAEKAVESDISAEIGVLQQDLSRTGNEAGETTLGNLFADAYKVRLNADFGMLNPGSMRADLSAGKVAWGHVYAVQPFGNTVGTVKLKGQDIYDLLEQQWTPIKTIMLQISGLTYTYDLNKPIGSRVVSIFKGKEPLVKNKIYSIGTSEFFAGGGDGFTVMQRGKLELAEGSDLDVALQHIRNLPQPFNSVIEGRIKKV